MYVYVYGIIIMSFTITLFYILIQSAYMNGFAGEDFYEFLFEEDVDAFKLSLIPGEKERLVKSVI